MKKTILGLFFLLVIVATGAQAQQYENGIGLRGGPFSGLTIKHFITDNTAIEGVLSTQWSGWLISGTWDKEAPAFNAEGLKWYYGAGAQIGFWGNSNFPGYDPNHGNYTILGVHGALGLEYTFKEIPFSVGLDWKPALNLIGYGNQSNQMFWGGNMSGAFIRFDF